MVERKVKTRRKNNRSFSMLVSLWEVRDLSSIRANFSSNRSTAFFKRSAMGFSPREFLWETTNLPRA
jgi:hypothetical protein